MDMAGGWERLSEQAPKSRSWDRYNTRQKKQADNAAVSKDDEAGEAAVVQAKWIWLFSAVLRIRIRIRIRMNPHDFGLLDLHPESAFQMRIPDADADSD